MIAIEIVLLTGRYHATPWGRHVNEGDVEWPPSPWRMLRALLATGFSKLGWREVPPHARRLFEALASAPPIIAIPAAAAGHTRHYMPQLKAKTSKVIDAFVDAGRGARIGFEWDTELDGASLEMLDELLAGLSYLGRAESWTEARRVERLDHEQLARCFAAASAPGPGYDRVPLLAPLPVAEYESWRTRHVATEAEAVLAKKRAAAEEKGKKPPTSLTAADARKAANAFPESLIAALLADTAELRKAGWSQPPGSQWLSYWRQRDALAPPPVVGSRRAVRTHPTTALLALASDTVNGNRLPTFADAVLRLELLHKALVKKSDRGGGPSPSLSGKANGVRFRGHQHAALLPLALQESARRENESSRRIDHILVHAPMGLDADAQEALRRVTVVAGRGMRYFVTLAGLGVTEDLAGHVPSVGAAQVWTSATPFVPPRHLKSRGKNNLFGQILAELESRRLPRPASVELEVEGRGWIELDGSDPVAGIPTARWRHFRRARLDEGRQPPTTQAFGLRLTFDAPIRGPLALGYACHFGLGLFEPLTFSKAVPRCTEDAG